MTKLAAILTGVLAVGALVMGLVAVIVDDRDERSQEGAVLVVPDGARARIDGPSGRRTVGSGEYELALGDRVEATSRSSQIELGGDGVLALREGFRGTDAITPDDTTVRIDRVPALLAGELLVVANSGPIDIAASGTRFRVEGAARVSRSLALTVGVYDDQVAIESAGRSVELPAYRQAAIVDLGLLPGRPVPYSYDERDPWDQRFLGEAIDLTKVLDSRAEGFTHQLPAGAGTADLFTSVFADLASEPAYVDGAPCATVRPGDCLVGLAIALEGRHGSYAERQTEVFGFRGEGAVWGLVALDQDVDRDGLLDRISGAVDRTPLLFALGDADDVEIPRSTPGTSPPPDDGGPPPTTSTTNPETTTTSTTTTEPMVPPTTIPSIPPPLDEAVDPAIDLIGDLLPEGGLDTDPLSDGVDDLTSELEGALREDQLTDGGSKVLG